MSHFCMLIAEPGKYYNNPPTGRQTFWILLVMVGTAQIISMIVSHRQNKDWRRKRREEYLLSRNNEFLLPPEGIPGTEDSAILKVIVDIADKKSAETYAINCTSSTVRAVHEDLYPAPFHPLELEDFIAKANIQSAAATRLEDPLPQQKDGISFYFLLPAGLYFYRTSAKELEGGTDGWPELYASFLNLLPMLWERSFRD